MEALRKALPASSGKPKIICKNIPIAKVNIVLNFEDIYTDNLGTLKPLDPIRI